jgi:hypothetical protein
LPDVLNPLQTRLCTSHGLKALDKAPNTKPKHRKGIPLRGFNCLQNHSAFICYDIGGNCPGDLLAKTLLSPQDESFIGGLL